MADFNKVNSTLNPGSTLDNIVYVPSADMWTPRNNAVLNNNVRIVNSKLEVLRSKLQKPATTTSPVSVPAGQPLQLKSVSAYQTAYKQQTKTYSLVSISFQPQTDPNFGGVRVWFTNYEGTTNPQLMTNGPTSPITFLAEATQETVTVTAQPYGVNGQLAPFAGALTTTLTLSGVVTAPPAPTVTQVLSAVPGGFQFTFALEGGLLADVVQTYKVYRNTINDSSTASVIQTIPHPSTNNGTYVVQDYPGGDLIEFYWVSAVNTVGLESALTAAQSSTNQALSLNYTFGNNFASNTGFEVNNIVLPVGTGVTTVDYPICDGWVVGRNDNNLFTLYNDAGFGRNGSKSLLMRTNANTTIPSGTSFCHVYSTVKFPIQTDDWAGWRCYYNILANLGRPAGVTVAVATGVRLYDNTNTWIATLFTNVTSPTFDGNFHLISQLVQQVYTNAVYCIPLFQVYVNNSGSPVSSGNGLIADVRWDDGYFFIQAPTGNGTPQSAAYTPNSQPLTANVIGTVATIHIAAYSVTYPFGVVSYSSGSITGLASSTKYYVVGSDRGYNGGSLSYQASTSNPTVNSSEAFIYLGFITTPASGGGGGTTGGTGGGGGSCFTANTLLKGGKPISEIVVGDTVWVEKDDKTQVERTVSKVFVHEFNDIMLDMGDDELVTRDHHFRENGKWVAAKFIFDDPTGFIGRVYNLEIDTNVDDEHNYVLANGHCAHNLIKVSGF